MAVSDAARKQRAPQDTGVRPAARKPRVLLVEDDPQDRQHILPVIEALGLTVDIAGDASEGAQLGGEREYVGAVVDLNLSSSSERYSGEGEAGANPCEGFALISALRERGCRFPIVILTHNSGIEYEVRGFEAGADDYMVKWPQRQEMMARLRRLMDTGEERG